MHESVMQFLRVAVEAWDLKDESVLEVGSRIINGSPRELFSGPYHGIDILEGPGVDEVMNAHELSMNGSGPPAVIVCAEMLEHDDAPWLSLSEMRAVAAEEAFLLVTARGYDDSGCYPVHESLYDDHGTYSVGDYWRFSVRGMRRLLEQTGWRVVHCERDYDPDRPGVFAVARAA